jgi:hypothetical protein
MDRNGPFVFQESFNAYGKEIKVRFGNFYMYSGGVCLQIV